MNAPGWSVDAVRAMTTAQRLTAVSAWVVSIFEDFAEHEVATGDPRLLNELNAVAISAAKQAAALLGGDIAEAVRLHDACDQLIASWEWAEAGGARSEGEPQ